MDERFEVSYRFRYDVNKVMHRVFHFARHGHGILYRKQPDTELYVKIYAGGWEGGKKHGLGVKYYRNGKYLGYWEQDQRSGQGFMWFDNGDFYIGEWVEDRFDGLGVFLEIGGNRYHGQFRGGLKYGEGVYLHARTGQIQRGFWNEGVFKMGEIEDWNRNQAIEPTAYPIPEVCIYLSNELKLLIN